MGEVFRAHDSTLKRDVALKMLPSAYALDPDRLARFRREAHALAALNHPHIAAIYGLQESDGRQALVLELVEGVTLADRIRKAPLSLVDALTIARQIAEALQAAHAKGIIHRDLKPANVKVTPTGVVKVLDFGLAKAAGDPLPTDVSQSPFRPGETRVGAVMGTAGYMSPEQARGQDVDARTDIWAFGCVLFELLAGVRAFGADGGSDPIAKILEGEPDWGRLPKHTPPKIQRLLRQCLQKDRETRPQTIAEARAVIEQLLAPRVAGAGMWAAIAAATIIAISAGAYVWIARRASAESERNATIAQVERLVDLGRFVDGWRMAGAGLQRWPGDARLEALMDSMSQTVTLRTDPPGADVGFKAYDDPDGEWIPIGSSPLLAVNAPLGMLRWRIAKPGFDPLEARFEVGAPAAAAGRPDVDAKPLRLRPVNGSFAGMVFVSGTAPLTDYWIDRTEVTNRDYKQFVDRGRYDQRFYDRSGSPGPSTWELGTYPPGQERHPVSGVAWFEADAYCRSVGKSLPTLRHWRRAFGESFFSEVISVGNFRGRGVESTDALQDVGPAGTVGMAGNVKEWVWNEVDGKRYILGGAWNEPLYMAIDDDARSPMDRSPTNGFRCIKETASSAAVAYEPVPVASGRDYTNVQPVDEPSFAAFRRFYAYDRLPLEAKTEWTNDFPEWRRERVSFSAAYGGERDHRERADPQGRRAAVSDRDLVPGQLRLGTCGTAIGALPFSYYFELLPRSGYAVIYPVFDGTYERSEPIGGQGGPVTGTRRRDRILRWSMDLGRTIDYLESRERVRQEQDCLLRLQHGRVDVDSDRRGGAASESRDLPGRRTGR